MHQKQSLMEGYCHRPCFFFAWLFFNILVSVLWRFVALPGYYILTCCPHSPVLFLFFFSLSLIPLFSLSLFLLPFIIRLLPPPIFIRHPPLSALNLCLSMPPSPPFSLPASTLFSVALHTLSLFMWLPFPTLQYNFLSSSLLCHPTILFSRPHSHVDLFRGGPRRDRRGGGCYRLHPALPPHRPRQIPHQTQRSTAHTLNHTDVYGCAHACMHERTLRYTCINMDTCVPRLSHQQACTCKDTWQWTHK